MAAAGAALGVPALSRGRGTEAQEASACPSRQTRARTSVPWTLRQTSSGAVSQCSRQQPQQSRSRSLGVAPCCSASDGQDGVKSSGKRRVPGGAPPKEKIPLVVERTPLDVVFEDEHILVINKPAGVRHEPIHRFAGGSLLNRVVGHLGFEPFTVHRLDMYTSGVLCIAKDVESAKALHSQFRQSTQQEKSGDLPAYKWKSDEQASGVHKRYVALALGTPRTTAFAVDAPIARHPHHKFARIVAAQPEDGARALTFFYMVSYNSASRAMLLEALPQTGRTHQIRVHLQHIGLPILGDHIYGEGSSFVNAPEDALHPFQSCQGDMQGSEPSVENEVVGESWKRSSMLASSVSTDVIQRQALHALSLSLAHPFTKQKQMFKATIPKDIKQAARVLDVPLPLIYTHA